MKKLIIIDPRSVNEYKDKSELNFNQTYALENKCLIICEDQFLTFNDLLNLAHRLLLDFDFEMLSCLIEATKKTFVELVSEFNDSNILNDRTILIKDVRSNVNTLINLLANQKLRDLVFICAFPKNNMDIISKIHADIYGYSTDNLNKLLPFIEMGILYIPDFDNLFIVINNEDYFDKVISIAEEF